MVITPPDKRSGISKKSNKPYAIQTCKVLAGTKTYNWTHVRNSLEELPVVPAPGTTVLIEVTDANRKAMDADIEVSGEVIVVPE